ncbi:MAG: DUF2142 domain-containing protein [Ruthenibacterium sp.]
MKLNTALREHFALTKRNWLAKGVLCLALILLSALLLYLFGQLYDRPAPGEYRLHDAQTGLTEAVAEGDLLTQTFVSPFDTLRAVTIQPDASASYANIMYIVRLYENDTLRSTTDFKTLDLVNGTYNLCGVPITDALHKTYRIEITMGRTTENQSVPFVLTAADDTFGAAQQNGKALSGALAVNLNTAPTGQADTYKVLLGLLSLALVAAVLCMGKKPLWNALVLILLFGCFMAVLNPVGDSPDEYAHYLRAEAVSRGHLFGGSQDIITVDENIHGLFLDADTSTYHFDKFSDAHLYALKAGDTVVQTTAGTSGNYIFLAYLASALGLLLGRGLQLPAMTVVFLCRVLNVFVYAALCGLAVHLAPKMKTTFAFLACFPFCVYLAASFNCDLMTFGLAFLLMAYLLRLWCAPDGTVGAKQLAVFSVIALCLALTKIPYLIFVPLILLLPRARYQKGKNRLWALAAVCLAGAVALVWLALSGAAGLRPAAGADAGQQLLYLLHYPGRVLNAVLTTMFEECLLMYQQWFTLGWLYYNFAYIGIIIPFVFYGIVTSEPLCEREVLGRSQKIFLCGGVAGAVFLTYMAMYISTMAVGATNVVGIQGRYLLPCAAALPLLLAKPNEHPQRAMQTQSAAYWSIGFLAVCVCNIILRHYM